MGPLLAFVAGVILFATPVLAFLALLSIVIVHPQEHKVILNWGKYSELLTEPGLYFRFIVGR